MGCVTRFPRVSGDAFRTHLGHLLLDLRTNTMPTLKLLEKFSSRSTAPKNSPGPDVGANNKESAPRLTIATTDAAVPGYSDGLKAAWSAAHQELPQARGAEGFLNDVDESTLFLRIGYSPTPLSPSSLRFSCPMLTLNGKRTPMILCHPRLDSGQWPLR